MASPEVFDPPPRGEGANADGPVADGDASAPPEDENGGKDAPPPEASTELEELRAQLAEAREKVSQLMEENDILQSRCKKLARAASKQTEAVLVDASTQTGDDLDGADGVGGADSAAPLPPEIDMMLRNPKDEAVQLNGIETLFAQQTQVDMGSAAGAIATPAVMLSASLEAVLAIFVNHPSNYVLLLKASQFTSLLLAESNAQEQLPTKLLFQIAKEATRVGSRLVDEPSSRAVSAETSAGVSSTKLMTWIISLVSALLPCLVSSLKDRAISEAFIQDLLGKLVQPLLASAELPQETLVLKCVQLLPLLPAEPWIQKAAVETGAGHSLALVYHRAVVGSDAGADAVVPQAVRTALHHVFSQNVELCVRALHDTFVGDTFVCVEVLEHLRGMGKRQRGIFVSLDSDHSILAKLLGLWAFHQRNTLEDASPQMCASREVLKKVAELVGAVLSRLPPQLLLRRMQEFHDSEVLQRIALATIHGSVQLRLQVAVNYVDNSIVPVLISCLNMLLQHYEKAPEQPGGADVTAIFRLLKDDTLPADGWPYIMHCLEVCNHVLSHWCATKISLRAGVLDSRSAPLLLAQSGLVDVLAKLVDPVAAGFELTTLPPQPVVQRATETLQALFEQNGHICLFCMQHYAEVRLMVALGCDSLATEPLAEFPDLQEKAVVQLSASFDRFATQDERMGRKILKALSTLFESSYRLVAWYLKENQLSGLQDFQSTDIHVEAIRSVCRAPYWSAEDAPLLPEFVGLICQLMVGSIEGHGIDPNTSKPVTARPGRRILDLTEAEEVVASSMSTLLHLMLIDPSPPTVLECIALSLARASQDQDGEAPKQQEETASTSETAVNAVMKVMQVFPSSDRLQLNCQHMLTSLLGE